MRTQGILQQSAAHRLTEQRALRASCSSAAHQLTEQRTLRASCSCAAHRHI